MAKCLQGRFAIPFRMTERLILFDIDGTLISAARSGFIALEKAIVEILQCPNGLQGIRLDGNTDTNALLQICDRDRIPFPDPGRLARFKKRYLSILRREISGKGHVKPGVLPLLENLAAKKSVHLGLVTGNFMEGAEIKLKRFDLWKYFPIGAFGCEHHDRRELVGLAMKRAGERSGTPFAPQHVTLIGDTPNDVKSCRPWGIKSLAVATGSTQRHELEQAGAHLSVDDLSDTPKILKFLLEENP